MTTTSKLSPFMILLNRADEKLNKGAFHRHDSVDERLRTHHRFAWTDVAARGELAKVPSPLGFGYLQAVLSVLRLFPLHVSYDAPGLVGRLEAKGTEMYHLSWNEADVAECLQGGFVVGGKPNYHSAVLGVAQAIAMAVMAADGPNTISGWKRSGASPMVWSTSVVTRLPATIERRRNRTNRHDPQRFSSGAPRK